MKSLLCGICVLQPYICAILSKSVSIPFIIIPTLLDLAMGEKMPSITKCVWRIIAAVAGIYLTFWANKQERHGHRYKLKNFLPWRNFQPLRLRRHRFIFIKCCQWGSVAFIISLKTVRQLAGKVQGTIVLYGSPTLKNC